MTAVQQNAKYFFVQSSLSCHLIASCFHCTTKQSMVFSCSAPNMSTYNANLLSWCSFRFPLLQISRLQNQVWHLVRIELKWCWNLCVDRELVFAFWALIENGLPFISGSQLFSVIFELRVIALRTRFIYHCSLYCFFSGESINFHKWLNVQLSPNILRSDGIGCLFPFYFFGFPREST